MPKIYLFYIILGGACASCASEPADVYLRGRYSPGSKITMDSVELDRLLLREAENRLLKERLALEMRQLASCSANKALEEEAARLFPKDPEVAK